MKLTQKRLMELLTYDPETGVFRRRVRRGPAVIGSVPGCITSDGYRRIGIDYRDYLAPRLAWLYMTGQWPDNEVDHINMNRSDDRFKNLRLATKSKNMQNRGAQRNNTTGFKGVWRHRKRFVMEIMVAGKRVRRSFPTIELAAKAYAEAAKKLHGNFARTNLIQE